MSTWEGLSACSLILGLGVSPGLPKTDFSVCLLVSVSLSLDLCPSVWVGLCFSVSLGLCTSPLILVCHSLWVSKPLPRLFPPFPGSLVSPPGALPHPPEYSPLWSSCSSSFWAFDTHWFSIFLCLCFVRSLWVCLSNCISQHFGLSQSVSHYFLCTFLSRFSHHHASSHLPCRTNRL